MKGVNKVIILGRLGSDPELKALSTGNEVARFSVATSEVWVDKSGQKQEKTEWHRIVVWGKLAGVVAKYTKKGSIVHIEGKLSTRSWEDNGQKKYATEIIASQIQFVGSKNDSGSSSGGGRSQSKNDFNMDDFGPEPDFTQSSDEDIPFQFLKTRMRS